MNTTELKHTTLPWKYYLHDNDSKYAAHIEGLDKNNLDYHTVAVILSYANKEENEANAAFIVRACNSYNARTKLLRASLDELKQTLDDIDGCDHSVGICCCGLIRLIENIEKELKQAEQEDK